MKVCSIDGCDGAVRARGWCTRHYCRWRKHGDPLVGGIAGANNPRWSGDEVTYSGMHIRVNRLRGKASDHLCVDCGSQAHHWSYDHTDPNPRFVHKVFKGPRKLVAYSTDHERYQPRCRSCHQAFDREQAGHQPHQEGTTP